MNYSIQPIASGFGAEITSFNAALPFNWETRIQLLRALFEYQLLIFRSQDLSVQEQINLTERLGDLEIPWSATNTHPEDSRLQIVSNAGREPGGYKTSSQYWHTDRSFVEDPSLITLLHTQQQPPEGGHTEFADIRGSYDCLAASLKTEIKSLRACHSYSFRFSELRKHRLPPNRASKELMEYPDVEHPLVRSHPNTGRRALYLSELCLSHINDMSMKESDILLAELYEHVLQEKFIYKHHWELGDLLVWDNAALMHRAVDIPQEYLRVLHRTAISQTSLT
jgi:taurine dioxygenase